MNSHRENKAATVGQMKEYLVSSTVTITVVTEVEAESPEDAEVEALGREMMHLCNFCASADPKTQWVTSGELDGCVGGRDITTYELEES